MYNFGLKLGSKDIYYTEEILQYYTDGIFQYIELFTGTNTFAETVSYWKQFNIPFGIHAPHSAAGMNLARKEFRDENKKKIEEVLRFADALKAHYIVFHSGTNGTIEETSAQLFNYVDERFLIENKPIKGLDGSTCVGSISEELKVLLSDLRCGFCLDLGHGICAANTLQQNPFLFVKKLMELNPRLYHLTDGDFTSELDSHLHYGEGSFPLKELLELVPDTAWITNEAKRLSNNSLDEFKNDCRNLRTFMCKIT